LSFNETVSKKNVEDLKNLPRFTCLLETQKKMEDPKTCDLSEKAKCSLKKFQCYHCKKKFGQKYKLAEHIEGKHINKCSICEKKFSKSFNLHQHLEICGLSDDSKLF